MKLFAAILFFSVIALLEIAATWFLFQSDSDALWRLLKDWFFVISGFLLLAGILFAAYRGRSYTELERLAATREKTISDMTAENLRLKAKIERLEDEAERLRIRNLRLQGDEDFIHRSKA